MHIHSFIRLVQSKAPDALERLVRGLCSSGSASCRTGLQRRGLLREGRGGVA